MGFHPPDEGLSEWPPDLNGLLLGRAPPGRGLPLLEVKGRARPPFHPPDEDLSVGTPPSLRKGLEVGRADEPSERKRLGVGRSEVGRGALGRL